MLDLRKKLLLSHLTVILLTVAAIGFILLTLGQQYFINALEVSLVNQAQLITRSILPGSTLPAETPSNSAAMNTVQQQSLQNIELEFTQNQLPLVPSLQDSNLAYIGNWDLNLSSELQTHFQILDTRAVVLLDSHYEDIGLNRSTEDLISNALRGIQGKQLLEIEGKRWLYLTLPIQHDSGLAGVITIGQPLQDINDVMADLLVRLGVALLVASVLTILVAQFLAARLSKPIRALTTAASHLGEGDFEYPLPIDGNDEITELKRSFLHMRASIQQEREVRTRFVSDVSHELRTPLTAIKGLAETLRDGAMDDTTVNDHFIHTIEQETDRLIRLVNDLLLLTRADSQALDIALEQVDLISIFDSTIEMFAPQLETKQLTLTQIDKPHLPVFTHPDRIQQILIILLDNACEHSRAGTDIKLSIRDNDQLLRTTAGIESAPSFSPLSEGEWLYVHISDQGPGIGSEHLPHIFDRFYRADASRSRHQGGSGLGLAIAKTLVKAMHAHIWLSSPALDRDPNNSSPGTTASLALPTQPPTDWL